MRRQTLGSVVDFAYGKGLPARARTAVGAVPVFGSAGRVGTHDRFLVRGPCVIVGRKGTIGAVHWSECDCWPIDTTFYVTAKGDLRLRYIYYLLKTLPLREMNSDAAVPGLNRLDALALEVRIVPPADQDTISAILSAYDDLIENNRRRIRLLEQAAQLLYREWFVHLRFPGHKSVRIVDGVPEGWERRPLGAVADIVMGQSPKSLYYNEHGRGLPFHQGVRYFGTRFPVHRIYSTAGNRLAETGDILVSVRAPVGRINIAPDRMIMGRGIGGVRSTLGRNHHAFLRYLLGSFFAVEDRIGTGTIFASITKKDFRGIALLHPTTRLIRGFANFVGPIDRQIGVLHNTNRALAQARDLLLPRLMNGEICV